MSVDEYRLAMAVQPKANKYGAHAIVYEGVRYHSKAELAFELHLRQLKVLGKVDWWVRQVPFVLPGGGATKRAQRYLLDFLIVPLPMAIYIGPASRPGSKPDFINAPPPRLVDVKGKMTPNSATKISVIQATHGVTVELVAPKDVDTWI